MAQARDAGAPVIAWVSFIIAMINFINIAWAVFLLIKAVNRIEDLEDREYGPTFDTKPNLLAVEKLLNEIRHELREDRK